MKFVAIAGTNRIGSTNRTLIEFIRSRYSYKAEIDILDISGLPVYSKVPEQEIPRRVTDLAQAVSGSDGVIISTPEYDHSVPAVLMNALEWLSYGIHPFYNKPVLIVGASFGTLGTSRAQLHLRRMLDAPELHAFVLPSSEFLVDHSLQAFDDNGQLKDRKLTAKLDSMVDSFIEFASAAGGVSPRQYEQEDIKRYAYVSSPDSPVYDEWRSAQHGSSAEDAA